MSGDDNSDEPEASGEDEDPFAGLNPVRGDPSPIPINDPGSSDWLSEQAASEQGDRSEKEQDFLRARQQHRRELVKELRKQKKNREKRRMVRRKRRANERDRRDRRDT